MKKRILAEIGRRMAKMKDAKAIYCSENYIDKKITESANERLKELRKIKKFIVKL